MLNLLLLLELFVYLRLINGILSLCISAHLIVLPLLNPVLNLTYSPRLITSSHSHASASDSIFDHWRYINSLLTLTLYAYPMCLSGLNDHSAHCNVYRLDPQVLVVLIISSTRITNAHALTLTSGTGKRIGRCRRQ